MDTIMATDLKMQVILRMNESKERIVKCLGAYNNDTVWQRPNKQLASVGNLVLHLCGNITQYIISSLGKGPDNRNRDAEFSTENGYDVAQLATMISNTIDTATEIIQQTPETELLRVRMVQGFELSGTGICIHVAEHLSYHTGQIAVHTKLLTEEDLGFYKNADLNIKNE